MEEDIAALTKLLRQSFYEKPLMQFKRSDLSRTFHYAQDELVALGGVKPVSVNTILLPQNANGLNIYRVGAGSAGLTGVGVGASLGVNALIDSAYNAINATENRSLVFDLFHSLD